MNLRAALLLSVTASVLLPSACCTVTIYEPMRGLQRPVVVDATADNFGGTRIFIRCLTNANVGVGDADKVCRNLATTLRAQAATVEVTVPRDRESGLLAPEGFDPDLVVEVDSKLEHEYDYPLLATVSVVTLTLIPSIDEQTFSHQIVVRGRDRSVLVSDSFRARFVNYTGIGVWSLNWLLDVFVRSDEQDMGGDEPKKDFSRDFYQQTSQLAFNARVRSDLLGLTNAARPGVLAEVSEPLPAVLTAPTTTSAPTTPTTTAPATAPPPTTPPATTPPPTAPTTPAPANIDPAEAAPFNY